MLLTKEVKTIWTGNTKEHYKSLGHIFTKFNEKFIVPIGHLLPSSNVLVESACDYCGEALLPRTFNTYVGLKKLTFIQKDACSNCVSLKKKEELQYKQDNKLLTIDSVGYWTFRENRLYEFKKYLEEFKTIDNMRNTKTGKKLYQNIINYNESMHDMVIELGYSLDDFATLSKKGYYNDFSKIENKISEFIKINSRFPFHNEITSKLRIDHRYIERLGGIYEIKRIMNYFDFSDLVDDRLFVNSSMLEFIVAQYLIHNNILYKREGKIIKSNRCRYDFYLTDYDIYIEVWGYEKNNSKISKQYYKNREKKEMLYKKQNYNLLSIEYNELQIHNLKQTIVGLNIKFSSIFNINESLKESNFISYKTISDEEILNKLLEVSHKDGFLPKSPDVEECGCGYLSRIIRKRHGSYYNFAKIMGFKIHGKLMDRSEMNSEIVFVAFENILFQDNVDIEKETLKNIELLDQINYWIMKNGGMINVKLDFYTMIAEKYKNIILPETTLYFIFGTLKNKREKEMGRSSEEQIVIAKNIFKNLILNNEINNLLFKEISGRYRDKLPMTDEEYKDNFLKVTSDNSESFILTPRGFDEFSEMSARGYVNHFQMHWIDILKMMGKFNKYDEYVVNEYREYLKDNRNDYTLEKFRKNHSYITSVTLMKHRTRQDWLEITKAKVNKKRYDKSDLLDNFEKVKSSLSRTPLFHEFAELSQIAIPTYANQLNIKNNSYDEIIKYYSTISEYNDYLTDKKEHKSAVGRITGAMSRTLSDDDLKENFSSTFTAYKNDFGKYPSKREFSKHSKYDESTYRGRLNLPWLQVVEYYGFKSKIS